MAKHWRNDRDRPVGPKKLAEPSIGSTPLKDSIEDRRPEWKFDITSFTPWFKVAVLGTFIFLQSTRVPGMTH